MGNRIKDRQAKRLQVRFRRKGDPDLVIGYSVNISPTGMFVGTTSPLSPRSLVEVEVLNPRGTVMVEGVVVHAARVSPLLKRLRPSGMGIRFTYPHPRMVEILSGQDHPSTPESTPLPARETPPAGSYVLDLSDPDRFRETFQKEIQFGEVRVETDRPMSVGHGLSLSVRVPGREEPLVFGARVVRVGTAVGEEDGPAVTPMHVAFPLLREVVAALRRFL